MCNKRKRQESITEEQRALARERVNAIAREKYRERYAAMSSEDKARRSALARARRAANNLTEAQKEKYKSKGRQRVLERREAAREMVIAIKTGNPCMDCGESFHHVAMDFDHRTGEDKRAQVSHLQKHGASIDVILAEIAKCDLVCANCHRVRTYNRHQGFEPEDARYVRPARRKPEQMRIILDTYDPTVVKGS
jgi:hypothetical protein